MTHGNTETYVQIHTQSHMQACTHMDSSAATCKHTHGISLTRLNTRICTHKPYIRIPVATYHQRAERCCLCVGTSLLPQICADAGLGSVCAARHAHCLCTALVYSDWADAHDHPCITFASTLLRLCQACVNMGVKAVCLYL